MTPDDSNLTDTVVITVIDLSSSSLLPPVQQWTINNEPTLLLPLIAGYTHEQCLG